MKQCPKGHIFDEKRNSECPYCEGTSASFQPLGGFGGLQPEFPKTVPLSGAADNGFPSTMPLDDAGLPPIMPPIDNSFPPTMPLDNNNSGFPPTMPLDDNNAFPPTMPLDDDNSFPPTMPLDNEPSPYAGGSSGNMSVTIALDQTETGINPVRGWLVAVDGEKKGTSFVIHGEQNSIGRGRKFDVDLSFDKAVSSDGNAVIAYDPKSRKFFLSPVLGKGKNNIYHKDSLLLMPAELSDYDKVQFGTTTFVFRSFCNESFTY